MKYHVLVKTNETKELYEYDFENIEDIKSNILKPYLNDEEFQFNGYFIEPSKVKRLVVSKTKLTSKESLNDVYNRLGPNVLSVITKSDSVFGDKTYFEDLTRVLLKEVKESITPKSKIVNISSKKKVSNSKTIFLGYSYRQIDNEFVSGFKDLLIDKGYEVIDGKADGLGSISQAIIEKISISDIVVVVMTKRDKKENGKFTTAAWLLEEKGAALALKKDVGMFVEEEIDESDIGGMQSDIQRFHFTRNNFLKVAMNFLKIIDKK
jgi:hypothetical protein